MVEQGQIQIKCFDDHVRKSRGRGGCHVSPSGSNAKNKKKSAMLKPILFHEVGNHMINNNK